MLIDLQRSDPEWVVEFVRSIELGEHEAFEVTKEFEDDHLPCCEVTYKDGSGVEFLWCGGDAIAAFKFLDSERAQKYLLDLIYDDLFTGLFAESWREDEKSVGKEGLTQKEIETSTPYSILGDANCIELLKIYLRRVPINEMLTHEDLWQRELASRYESDL